MSRIAVIRDKLLRKKKKNILTEEQLQKKNEMEEKRKAHMVRIAEEQKRQVIQKIMNVVLVSCRKTEQKETS